MCHDYIVYGKWEYIVKSYRYHWRCYSSKKWNFSRAADHELVAEIASHWCAYRLYFTWSENINALSFSITFDIKFPETKLNKAYELLGLINENLWIGHFDITSKNGIPAFRHTLLSNNSTETFTKNLKILLI